MESDDNLEFFAAWIDALESSLNDRVSFLKGQFETARQPSPQTALASAIITISSLSWALAEARAKMESFNPQRSTNNDQPTP
jgi:hypothetical protein